MRCGSKAFCKLEAVTSRTRATDAIQAQIRHCSPVDVEPRRQARWVPDADAEIEPRRVGKDARRVTVPVPCSMTITPLLYHAFKSETFSSPRIVKASFVSPIQMPSPELFGKQPTLRAFNTEEASTKHFKQLREDVMDTLPKALPAG